MTEEKLETLVQAVRHWADREVDRLVYRGTRPLSICPTVEAATREAAIARGNAMAHSAEITEIQSVPGYVADCLKARSTTESRDLAVLTHDAEAEKQDDLSDEECKRKNHAGKPAHFQRALLRFLDLKQMGNDDRPDRNHDKDKADE